MNHRSILLRAIVAVSLFGWLAAAAANPWVVYPGGKAPGKGKHIVLVSGDEEYRSEEALPQLGKILSQHHGFKCTVLFAIDEDTGTINPNNGHNIPGLEALKTADLMIIFTRFRDLPDHQMKHIVDYVESGKPVLGIRTATHAFNIPEGRTYRKYDWRHSGEEYFKGFGRQVLGETWVSHWGHHKHESTRGIIPENAENHPITRGLKDGDIWGPTDVYEAHPPKDSEVIVLGQVVAGMNENDPPAKAGPHYKTGERVDRNNPMMPIAWTRSYKGGRVFCSTIGASKDMLNEGVRRLLVNGAYWCLGMENRIPKKSNVDIVGKFEPTAFTFHREKNYWPAKGMRPEDHALEK